MDEEIINVKEATKAEPSAKDTVMDNRCEEPTVAVEASETCTTKMEVDQQASVLKEEQILEEMEPPTICTSWVEVLVRGVASDWKKILIDQFGDFELTQKCV